MKDNLPAWRCIHKKCGHLAYYVSHVVWWDEKQGRGESATNPIEIPEGAVVSFDGTAHRTYPDGSLPKMKKCPCYHCGEMIPMYPDKNVLILEWDEPDWYGHFCDALKRDCWSAASAMRHLLSSMQHKRFADMPDGLKRKFETALAVWRLMKDLPEVFDHEGYIEHDERKRHK